MVVSGDLARAPRTRLPARMALESLRKSVLQAEKAFAAPESASRDKLSCDERT